MSKHEHDHDCECGCDHDNLDLDDITVTLTLEDDSELECEVIAIFPVDEKDYIALTPKSDDESEETEIFFYRFQQDGDEQPEIFDIEDDDEHEAVEVAFDELLDSAEWDDIIEEDISSSL